MNQRSVILRDTTLREGIQVPGMRLSAEWKHAWVKMLAELGVTEIEIGLPDGVGACVEVADTIRDHGYNITPTALIPCYSPKWQQQVDLAAEHAIRRVDVLCPFSDHLLGDPRYYGMTVAEIGPRIEKVALHARAKSLDVAVGCMDITRTPVERLLSLAARLRDAGVSRLTSYDSVGCMIPSRMKTLVSQILKATGLPVLVHCHNDYGMATANTLAAIEGGATAVDVAMNGLGGRAGNAALEEVALALENLYGIRTGLALGRLTAASALVEKMTGLPNSPLKPIVGPFCFAHSPVMHIRSIAGGNPSAFEPFDPAQIGARRTYDFSLAVDYTKALEPFITKAGVHLTADEMTRLVEQLRNSPEPRGWTEEQIIELIRRMIPMVNAGGTPAAKRAMN